MAVRHPTRHPLRAGIKARTDQLGEELLNPAGYQTFWHSAERKGYSGVAVFTKIEPVSVDPMGVREFDVEGRVQVLGFPAFSLVNAYFPNSQEKGARLAYKVAFCEAVLDTCNRLRADGHNVVLCGDLNIAHKPIDLKNPELNAESPGYLPDERAWMDRFIAEGYTDTFRMFTHEAGHYTWWSYRLRARPRDIGWRIDYFCVNREFSGAVEGAGILKNVMGSDHCPVTLQLQC